MQPDNPGVAAANDVAEVKQEEPTKKRALSSVNTRARPRKAIKTSSLSTPSEEVLYQLNDPQYQVTRCEGTPWVLPLKIELMCKRHKDLPPFKITAILWYADLYQKSATNQDQSSDTFECFHWALTADGEERTSGRGVLTALRRCLQRNGAVWRATVAGERSGA